ncbi:MAG: hypothetical protein U1C33_04990 [Candidatus Cloacimonadaceae bacterium]|nr:hypothetical protein [Candidatus Cloacimonadaceae bacterium]
MRRFILLVVAVFALLSTAWGQSAWDSEIVLRKFEILDLDFSTCPAPDGGLYVLYVTGVLGDISIYLQKINTDGMLAWNDPVLITGQNNSAKKKYSMFSSGDGNFFVYWLQDNGHYISKIDPSGQFLWNPSHRLIFQNTYYRNSKSYVLDNNGGLYFFYSRYIAVNNSDIWGQHISASGEFLYPGDGVQIPDDPRF